MSRPRITARYQVDPIDITTMGSATTETTEGLTLEVTFDRSEHLQALRLLEAAVQDVRRQIADAAEGSGE